VTEHSAVKSLLRGRQLLGGAFGHRDGQFDELVEASRPGGEDAYSLCRRSGPAPFGEGPNRVINKPQRHVGADEAVLDLERGPSGVEDLLGEQLGSAAHSGHG